MKREGEGAHRRRSGGRRPRLSTWITGFLVTAVGAALLPVGLARRHGGAGPASGPASPYRPPAPTGLTVGSPSFSAPPPAPVPDPDLSGLRALLDEEAARIEGVLHVDVRLADGREAGIRADEPVNAASLIKVPIMVALYDAWESGARRRTRADERRLRLMITRSKNIVTNQLIDELGMERINACLRRRGYAHLRLRSHILGPEPNGPNEVTAAEMTRLLGQIERRELISRKAGDEMRRLLLAQHWRERIPAGLPPGVVVGNKTGTLSGCLHDTAFVEAPDGLRYTLAALVERSGRAQCRSESLAELSRRVFEYLDRARREAAPEPRGAAARAFPGSVGREVLTAQRLPAAPGR